MRTALAAASALACLATSLGAQSSHPNLIYATVQAGGAPLDLRLDLQVPAGAGPFPVLVWIHGGGWQGGTRAPIPVAATRHLARGYAVASIDYRLSGTAIWPAQIHDCKAAIRFLRANAASYALDPDRIGVMGSSAGGHLVLALATMGDVGSVRSGSFAVDLEGSVGAHAGTSSRVGAAVDLFGPTNMLHAHDFPTFDHDAPGSPESILLGGPLQQNPEKWATVDPISFLSPDDAPLLVLHGTDDTTVPFYQSELLLDAARAIGHDAQFFAVQGNGHGGPGFSSPEANALVDAFLDRTLRDLPAATVSVAAIDGAANESGDPAQFRVRRTGSVAAPLAVRLWLGGDVMAGADCAALPLLVEIPAGQAFVDVDLVPRDDALLEGEELAHLHAVPSELYRIEADLAHATALLTDDESPSGLPLISVAASDPSAAEAALDPGAFRFTRTGSTAAALEVIYEIAGTASAGIDCLPLAGRVAFIAGSATALAVVRPLQDPFPEAGETIVVRIAAAAHYARGAERSAHVVLADDDRAVPLPIVGVIGSEPALAEPADGGAFTLTRTGGTLQPLTVRFAIAGSATSGSDFAPLGASAVIPSGAAWVRVGVAVLDDALPEGTEELALVLVADPTYRIGAAARRALAIADDEAPPAAASPVRLAVSPLALREAASASLIGGAPSGAASLWVGAAPSYVPLPPFGALLFDPLAAFPIYAGALDASGALHFAFVVPDLPALVELRLWWQAFASTSASPFFALSDVAERRVLPPRAL